MIHGSTSTYTNHGCRCDKCREAMRLYSARRRGGRYRRLDPPTIQAFDDPDGTIYRLRREGHPDVHADWPHPLYELAPDAIRLPSVGIGLEGRHSVVMIGTDPRNGRTEEWVATSRDVDWMPQCSPPAFMHDGRDL